MAKATMSREFIKEEVGLALRNPGMPLEGLCYDITPIEMHHLLAHFDIPFVDPQTYELVVGGRVRAPLNLTLDELKARPAVTMPVMMECAGAGQAHLPPRPVSAPWQDEAIGCSEWTGTPLRPILEEAGLLDDAVEILFTGQDRDIEHDYERSLSLEEALRGAVIIAYAMNGQPLPPRHGSPLRLVVPEWYGMASVKWLKEIKAFSEPFECVQQALLYHYRQSEEDPATPVTRKQPHALMAPPEIPDFFSRMRHVSEGRTLVEGRAWSGWGPVERVEFSADGGHTWADAALGEPVGRYAWVRWSYKWDAADRQRRGLEPGWLRRQRRPACGSGGWLTFGEGRSTWHPTGRAGRT